MAKKVTAVNDATPPTAGHVATLLGKSYAQFKVLTSWPGAASEWRRYSKGGPWVVKVSEGDRALFYIAPKSGHCEITVVLGERAVAPWAFEVLAWRSRSGLLAVDRERYERRATILPNPYRDNS